MGALWKILSGPASGLIDSIGKIIDNVTTTDAEKLEAQRKLVEIERSFQEKVMELDQQWAQTQADVIKTETNSQSMLARNWRPILMLVFTYIVAHNFVIAPLFHLSAVPIPPDMWELLRLGIGGYIVGRSAEKIAPQVTEIFAGKK